MDDTLINYSSDDGEDRLEVDVATPTDLKAPSRHITDANGSPLERTSKNGASGHHHLNSTTDKNSLSIAKADETLVNDSDDDQGEKLKKMFGNSLVGNGTPLSNVQSGAAIDTKQPATAAGLLSAVKLKSRRREKDSKRRRVASDLTSSTELADNSALVGLRSQLEIKESEVKYLRSVVRRAMQLAENKYQRIFASQEAAVLAQLNNERQRRIELETQVASLQRDKVDLQERYYRVESKLHKERSAMNEVVGAFESWVEEVKGIQGGKGITTSGQQKLLDMFNDRELAV
jgi:hypothetical protein